jgi:hypothetical protein
VKDVIDKMNKDQRDLFAKMAQGAQGIAVGGIAGGGGGVFFAPSGPNKDSDAIVAKAMKSAEGILTAEQGKDWRAMVGPKASFPLPNSLRWSDGFGFGAVQVVPALPAVPIPNDPPPAAK